MEVTNIKLWPGKGGNTLIASGVVEFDNILEIRVAVFSRRDAESRVSYPYTKSGDKYYDEVKFLNQSFREKIDQAILEKVKNKDYFQATSQGESFDKDKAKQDLLTKPSKKEIEQARKEEEELAEDIPF